MNLVFRDSQRREQKLLRQFEIAFQITWRNATLVRPEKMDVVWEGRRAAVPDFSGLGLFHNRCEKLLRDAPARQRNAMQFAGVMGRFDFVQPSASGGMGQFIGGGEENQFKVFHFTICGSCQTWPLWASKSSAAIGPQV